MTPTDELLVDPDRLWADVPEATLPTPAEYCTDVELAAVPGQERQSIFAPGAVALALLSAAREWAALMIVAGKLPAH